MDINMWWGYNSTKHKIPLIKVGFLKGLYLNVGVGVYVRVSAGIHRYTHTSTIAILWV